MKKHCFFGVLFFLSIFFLRAQEKIVIEGDHSSHEEESHSTVEIIFDDQGINKRYTASRSITTVVKEGNIYTVTDTSTNNEDEVWRKKEQTHYIAEKDGILTVWWNTSMQPMTTAITEETIKLETGERLDFSLNYNTITLDRYVLSYENGRLIKIDDPRELQLFYVDRQNSQRYVIDVVSPGLGIHSYQIQTDTKPKSMRQNAINFLILLFDTPIQFVPFIIGRY